MATDNSDKQLMNPIPSDLSPMEQETIAKIIQETDLQDHTTALIFGAASQRKTNEFIDNILKSVSNNDLDDAGDMLTELVVNLKDFDASATEKQGFLSKLFSSPKKQFDKMVSNYSSAEANIDAVVKQLDGHRTKLLHDVTTLENLYKRNIDYINDLELFIRAGESIMNQAQTEKLPALKAKADESGDQLDSQLYKDMADNIERFSKRVHDLKLTKTVSLQMLPQIRLQQSSNNVLIDKIHSSIVNSIPIWKSQMVIAMGLSHTRQALEAQKAVSDTTNELLRRNAEMLKTGTIEIAQESERSIIDIDTIRNANQSIIQSIEEIGRIQKEGRANRKAAEEELKKLDVELKDNIFKALEG